MEKKAAETTAGGSNEVSEDQQNAVQTGETGVEDPEAFAEAAKARGNDAYRNKEFEVAFEEAASSPPE